MVLLSSPGGHQLPGTRSLPEDKARRGAGDGQNPQTWCGASYVRPRPGTSAEDTYF